jgi:hypothetical protein
MRQWTGARSANYGLDASEGKCVFAMPVERNFAEIDWVMAWRPLQ